MLPHIVTTIRLERSDILLAATAGVLRQLENILARRKSTHAAAVSKECNGFQHHIMGCVGEYVIARHLKRNWRGKGKLREPDIDPDVQVRCTYGGKSLVVYKNDPDNAPFYFVRWLPDTFDFQVSSPVLGAEIKQPQYWRDDDHVMAPGFFYPVK